MHYVCQPWCQVLHRQSKPSKHLKILPEIAHTESTPVRRYMGQRTPQPDAYRARTARRRHHQLRLSGLGSLNGLGLARFLRLARGFDVAGFGMGKGFGLGCCLRQASPTTSLISMVLTRRNGVMPNHQLETISTSQPKTARPDFLSTGPISSRSLRMHPFWRTPHSFGLSGNRRITKSLEPIKSLNPGAMMALITPAHLIGVISQFVGADGEGLNAGLDAVVAQGADIALAATQPGTTKLWGVGRCS